MSLSLNIWYCRKHVFILFMCKLSLNQNLEILEFHIFCRKEKPLKLGPISHHDVDFTSIDTTTPSTFCDKCAVFNTDGHNKYIN